LWLFARVMARTIEGFDGPDSRPIPSPSSGAAYNKTGPATVGDPSTRELGVGRLPVPGFRCKPHKRRRPERGEILRVVV